MTKKKNEQAEPNKNLRAGMVFDKSDSVYDKQMILSQKAISVTNGIARECVAWNSERCRRYDTVESELLKCKQVGALPEDELAKYIIDNKTNEWEAPKAPFYK